jgi:DNA-binding transcriptional regulator YhcF (GntR family)
MRFQFQLDKDSRTPIYDQVREQLLSALHRGRIREGAKLPSVRNFARVHGVNPKTIHRIYRRLHEAGYLTLRRGSGAYVAPVQRGDLDGARLMSLHRFFRNSLAECERMGVNPDRALELFESFVSRQELKGSRVALVGSTFELVNVLGKEVESALGIDVLPMAFESLQGTRQSARLKQIDLFVTTDSHFAQVRELASALGRPALRVQLDPGFVPGLLEAAERGSLLMVVSRALGMDGFLSALSVLGLSDEARKRIRVLVPEDPAELRRHAARADTLYVSPLVNAWVEKHLPADVRRLQVDQHLAPESLDLIEAALLFSAQIATDH